MSLRAKKANFWEVAIGVNRHHRRSLGCPMTEITCEISAAKVTAELVDQIKSRAHVRVHTRFDMRSFVMRLRTFQVPTRFDDRSLTDLGLLKRPCHQGNIGRREREVINIFITSVTDSGATDVRPYPQNL